MTRKLLLPAALLLLFATAGRADVVRILDDPREALQARVDVIQQARDKVNLLYFLARDDRITLGILALLRDARRRGVGDVRVIVDGSFHRIPKAVLAHLADEGVQVRVYHPLDLRHPSWMFHRMHEKVIAVDGARYITGGRNLAEDYFGLARRNFLDRDVYVEGASAAEADRHFEALWSSRHVAALHVRVSARKKEAAAQLLGDVLAEMSCNGLIALDTKRDWSDGLDRIDSVRFVSGAHVGDDLAEVLRSARRSIVIESPYFVPPRFFRDLLREKLREGVHVMVLTNSVRSTDGLLPQVAYLEYRHELARAGIDFREYKGPDTLHAKSIVVDGRVAMIGSYNVDPRSQYLNTEVTCVIDDEEVARALLDSIETHLANAWTINHAPEPDSLRAWTIRLLLPLIEHQL